MNVRLKSTTLAIATFALSLTVSVAPFSTPAILPAVAQSQSSQDLKAEADRLLQQGIQHFKVNQVEAALQFWKQALATYQKLKDPTGEARTLHNLGSAYGSLSQYDQAISYYQQALPIFQQTKDRHGEANALLNLGIAYEALSQHDKAIRSLQQTLPIFREVTDRHGEANTLMRLGIAYKSLSQYDRAISYHQQAILIFQQVNDRNGEASAMGNLGTVYDLLSQQEKAIASYQKALAIFQQLTDRNGEANTLSNLGSVYQSLSQRDEAISYYQQALLIYQQIKDRNGEVSTLNNLGIAYQALSEYDKAISYYHQALPYYQQVNDHKSEAKVLVNLGIAYKSLSQYDAAIAHYEKALSIFQQGTDRNGEASTLNSLGIVYRYLFQHDKAITYHQQALLLFQQLKDPHGEARALSNLGNAYAALSQHDKAITYFQQALRLFQQKDRDGEANTQMNLGNAYTALLQYDKAITYHQQALRLFRQLKDPNGEAKALTNLGVDYQSLLKDDKALTYFQQALPLFQQVKDREGEGMVFNNIGNIVAAQKQPEVAIVFYKQSVNVREGIRADLRGLSRDLQTSYTESVAGTYRRLAGLLLSQGRILEAQQVLELLKIQELRDYTRDTRAGGKTQGSPYTSPESAVIPPFNTIINLGLQLSQCEQQKPYCPERDQLLSQRDAANAAFNQQADKLRTLAKQQNRDPAQLQREELTVAAQKIVQSQPHTVLIYPLVLEDKLWLVWGTQAGKQGVVFASKEIPVSRKELAQKVLEFRTLLETPGDVKQLQQVSHQLYQWLVEPLRAELDANGIRTLVFSLDRSTRYIPMAALFDGKQYLVDRFTISTILTAGLTDTHDQLSPNIDNDPVLGLGLSQPVANFNPLPNVPDELNGIVRSSDRRSGIYPGLKLLNQAFTPDAFKKLIDYRILHIATHGQFVPGNPEDSFLVLGNGQPLKIPQIETLTDLGGIHLVVLSACETAKGGADKEGLEVSGISYYFLTSGAKSVIASLWLVNDASTSQLMQQFYQNLATGMSKAEALRQAQRSLLKAGSNATDQTRSDSFKLPAVDGSKPISRDRSHPYYWAPFILIGNNL
ncbi:MAG: tetratricopeptide repeat protein [Scytolyngbya sp. HA4215-MV1]|nr:tetratricopeptide repeat protein [Scytolyngbya sp. HA4215-MV1]